MQASSTFFSLLQTTTDTSLSPGEQAAAEQAGEVVGYFICFGCPLVFVAGVGALVFFLIKKKKRKVEIDLGGIDPNHPMAKAAHDMADKVEQVRKDGSSLSAMSSSDKEFDAVAKVQEKLIADMGPQSTESEDVNAAAKLMIRRKYDEALAAYQSIASRYPDSRATALSQIGVAHFFKGEYEKAIEFYEAAVEAGYPADMGKDNIDEAKEALRKKG